MKKQTDNNQSSDTDGSTSFSARAIALLIFGGIFCGILFAASLFYFSVPEQQKQEVFFTVDAHNDEQKSENIQLKNHKDQLVKWADFSNKNRLVYFGYTYCPDVCPTELATMTKSVSDLEKQGLKIQPIFVSVDPERDDPETLNEYVDLFHKNLIGLTGSVKNIEKMAALFKVSYDKTEGFETDPDYLLDHTSAIFFVNKNGDVIDIFDGGLTSDDITEILMKRDLN